MLTPAPAIDSTRQLRFQARLAEEKVEFTQVNRVGTQITFARPGPNPLTIQIGQIAPPIGQLLMISTLEQPGAVPASGVISLDLLREESQVVFDVFREIWPEVLQASTRDTAIHALYDSGVSHAFQYLWEMWLGQSEKKLGAAGLPLFGGGLRFVFSGAGRPNEATLSEIKVESFFPDSGKLYLDVQRQWQEPALLNSLSPADLLRDVETFLLERAYPFVHQTTD